MSIETQENYTQDYRHFDNLIWQVPAWATAVFSLSMASAALVIEHEEAISKRLQIDAVQSLSVCLFALFVILLLFGNVFLRFRLHQRTIYRPRRREVPHLWFMIPGQTALLLLIFIEATVVLIFALITSGVPLWIAQISGTLFLAGGFIHVETNVRKIAITISASRKPKWTPPSKRKKHSP